MEFRLRRVASPSLFALVLFAASASCGHKSETNFSAHSPFAYVQWDCGPADGGALTFYFIQKQSRFGKYEEPFVEISIKVGLRTPSHSVLR